VLEHYEDELQRQMRNCDFHILQNKKYCSASYHDNHLDFRIPFFNLAGRQSLIYIPASAIDNQSIDGIRVFCFPQA
jgi:hypothetical protein